MKLERFAFLFIVFSASLSTYGVTHAQFDDPGATRTYCIKDSQAYLSNSATPNQCPSDYGQYKVSVDDTGDCASGTSLVSASAPTECTAGYKWVVLGPGNPEAPPADGTSPDPTPTPTPIPSPRPILPDPTPAPTPGPGTGDSGSPTPANCKGVICLPENPFGNKSIAGSGTLGDAVSRVIKILLFAAGIVAVLFIIIGGFWYMTSAGNEEQAKKGRTALTYAIVGLIIIILSFVIVTVVTNTLTGGT